MERPVFTFQAHFIRRRQLGSSFLKTPSQWIEKKINKFAPCLLDEIDPKCWGYPGTYDTLA